VGPERGTPLRRPPAADFHGVRYCPGTVPTVARLDAEQIEARTAVRGARHALTPAGLEGGLRGRPRAVGVRPRLSRRERDGRAGRSRCRRRLAAQLPLEQPGDAKIL